MRGARCQENVAEKFAINKTNEFYCYDLCVCCSFVRLLVTLFSAIRVMTMQLDNKSLNERTTIKHTLLHAQTHEMEIWRLFAVFRMHTHAHTLNR